VVLVATEKILTVKAATSIDQPACLVSQPALFSARYLCCAASVEVDFL